MSIASKGTTLENWYLKFKTGTLCGDKGSKTHTITITQIKKIDDGWLINNNYILHIDMMDRYFFNTHLDKIKKFFKEFKDHIPTKKSLTLYDILGIDDNASMDEITKAYRKMALIHHPDKGGKAEDFRRLKDAYDTLKFFEKREKYDTSINADCDLF